MKPSHVERYESLDKIIEKLSESYRIDYEKIKRDLHAQINSANDVYNLADLCLSNRLKHNDYELFSTRLLSLALELENGGVKFSEFIESLYKKGIASRDLKLFSYKHRQEIEKKETN